MAIPFHQKIIRRAVYALTAIVAFGAFLDSISNAISIVSPPVTYIASTVIFVVWFSVELILTSRPMLWVTSGGQCVHLRRLGAKTRFALAGVIFLLWLPRLIDGFKADQAPIIPFTPSTFGIYIGEFSNDKEQLVQSDIEETLVRHFEEEGLSKNVIVRKLPITFNVEDGFAKSQDLAKKNNAQRIIWGVRGQQQFYPRVTLIDKMPIPKKEILLAQVIYNQSEMYFPPQVLGQMDELLHFVLASSYVENGDLQKAINSTEKLLNKTASRKPGNDENVPHIYLFVGYTFLVSALNTMNKSYMDKAVYASRQGLEKLKADPRLESSLRSNLGLALAASAKFVEGKEQLVRATELKTEDVAPYMNLAFIMELEKEMGISSVDDAAIVAVIDKGLEIASDHPVALYNKAVLLRRQGLHEDAIKYLQRAVIKKPWITKEEEVNIKCMNAMIHSELAGAYMSQDAIKYAVEIIKEHKSAIELLESIKHFEIANVSEELAESYNAVGAYYVGFQDHVNGERYIKRSLEYDANNKEAHYNLGKIYVWRLDFG